jgi:hypothetical protein
MKKIMSTAASIVLVAVSSVGALAAPPMTLAPTFGGPPTPTNERQQYVMNWCSIHRYDPSCNDFRSHRSRWNDNDYGNWYQTHRNTNGFDPLAAGIFGFVAGAIVSGAVNSANHSGSHVAACENRYRSYNASSDTYVGYDGRRHRCML